MSAMMIESKCGIVQCSLSSMKYEFRKTMAHSLTLSVQDFIRPALLFAKTIIMNIIFQRKKKDTAYRETQRNCRREWKQINNTGLTWAGGGGGIFI